MPGFLRKKSFEIWSSTNCGSFFFNFLFKCKFSIDLPPCCLRVYFWFLLPAARILKPSPLLARRNRCGVHFLWFVLLESMAPSAVLWRETKVSQILCCSTLFSWEQYNRWKSFVLCWPSTLSVHVQDNCFSYVWSKFRETEDLEKAFSECLYLTRTVVVAVCCVLLKLCEDSGLQLP